MILGHIMTRNVNKRTSVEMSMKIGPRFNNQLRDISDEVNLSGIFDSTSLLGC